MYFFSIPLSRPSTNAVNPLGIYKDARSKSWKKKITKNVKFIKIKRKGKGEKRKNLQLNKLALKILISLELIKVSRDLGG